MALEGPGHFQSPVRSSECKLCCRWHFQPAEWSCGLRSIHCPECPHPASKPPHGAFLKGKLLPPHDSSAFPEWPRVGAGGSSGESAMPSSAPQALLHSCCPAAGSGPARPLLWRQRLSALFSAHPEPGEWPAQGGDLPIPCSGQHHQRPPPPPPDHQPPHR